MVNSFLETEKLGKLMRQYSLPCIISLLLRELVCGVGLVLILPIWFGLDGLLYFMPISDVVTLAAAFFVLFAVVRQLKPIDRYFIK